MAGDDEDVPLSEEIAKKWDPKRLLQMVSSRAGRGQPLDAVTRSRYENKLGVNLGDVRVYTGEFAQKVTEAHRAEALTIGQTGMILMRGSPDRSPLSAAGRALMAHELTHVAQASRGVHRRASFQEATPLATEEHEAEAEQAEAEELSASSGRPGAESGKPNQGELDEDKKEAVLQRVLELFEESERVGRIRAGPPRYRP